ncbi:MAG: prepilin peptidase [Anaerovoracaceae bacterium]|jgi:leader peptidase (prepilin peptidase)/N-methyltransferase
MEEIMAVLVVCGVVVVLLAIAYVDLKTEEIPYRLNLMLLAWGLAAAFIFEGPGWRERLLGALCISLPMMLMNVIIRDSFGGGDILMCASGGVLLGWQGIMTAACIGFTGGGIMAVFLLAAKKRTLREHFALGPFLAAGMITALLFQCGGSTHFLR